MDNVKLMEQIKIWEPLINKVSQRYCNNICSVEDLKTEAILGIINGMENFDAQKGNMKTYMFKCISNAIRNAAITSSFSLSVPSGSIKSIKEQSKYHAVPLSESITSPEVNTYIEEDIHELIKKYDKKNIAHLYFIERNNYKEISEITGLSCSTISRFINKVRKKIKDKLS